MANSKRAVISILLLKTITLSFYSQVALGQTSPRPLSDVAKVFALRGESTSVIGIAEAPDMTFTIVMVGKLPLPVGADNSVRGKDTVYEVGF
ncbi:MAG: hypothetical protein QXQ70_07050 [Candidatus Caldarchaeum sp.]